jgi:CRISPR type I-E-associated protein CasB/Cse2
MTAPSDDIEVADQPVWARIREIARRLSREGFDRGALASLRRNDPSTVVGQPAFHRLLAEVDQWVGEDEAIRWATLVHIVAITAPCENGALWSGKALASAGLSEARFTKLLAARGKAFREQLCIIARYLAAKQTSIDWGDLGELALVEGRDEERAETLRFRVARGYYRELGRADGK